MQDEPQPIEILAIVATFLREEAVPALSGRQSFHARVAANAVDLVRRHIELADASEKAETARLRAIFAAPSGGLAELNERLTRKLATGEMDLASPGVRDHLWRTTLEKLAVDQPNYGSYKRTLEERGQ
jgi:hypothetical protein